MNAAAPAFDKLTALLEDLHAISVEGQKPDLTPDEGWALLGQIKLGAANLSRTMIDAALVLT